MATLLVWTFIYNLLIPTTSIIQPMSIEESHSENIEISNDDFRIVTKPSTQNSVDLYENNKLNDATSTSLLRKNDHISENFFLFQMPNKQVCFFKHGLLIIFHKNIFYKMEFKCKWI